MLVACLNRGRQNILYISPTIYTTFAQRENSNEFILYNDSDVCSSIPGDLNIGRLFKLIDVLNVNLSGGVHDIKPIF